MTKNTERLIQEKDVNALFDWCADNDHDDASSDVLEQVAEIYDYLIDAGFGEAANNLGTMYYKGRHFKKDTVKGAEYYQIACDMGIPIAYSNLGKYYYFEAKDFKKAYEIFSEGVLFFNHPACKYMLAEMYRKGEYVIQSDTKAMHLYFKIVEDFDDENSDDIGLLGRTYLRLGEYLTDRFDPEDIDDGYDYLCKALSIFNRFRFLHEDAEQEFVRCKELIDRLSSDHGADIYS